MSSDPLQDEFATLWQSQAADSVSLSLAQIHYQARRLRSRVRSRNLIEYIAGAVAAVLCVWFLVQAHGLFLRSGFVLCVAGILYVSWQLSKRGSAHAPSQEMAIESCVAFHRSELERQRELLLSVWSWYLAPLVPGLLVVTLAGAVDRYGFGERALAAAGIGLGLDAVLFFGIWKLNRVQADKIQRAIDELKRV